MTDPKWLAKARALVGCYVCETCKAMADRFALALEEAHAAGREEGATEKTSLVSGSVLVDHLEARDRLTNRCPEGPSWGLETTTMVCPEGHLVKDQERSDLARARLEGVGSVVSIRCREHWTIQPLNETEGGGECGACAHAAGKAEGRREGIEAAAFLLENDPNNEWDWTDGERKRADSYVRAIRALPERSLVATARLERAALDRRRQQESIGEEDTE